MSKNWVVITDSADSGADWQTFGDVEVMDIDYYYLTNSDGIAEMENDNDGEDYAQNCINAVRGAPEEVQAYVKELMKEYL